MTGSLKGHKKNWRWSEALQTEFGKLKDELRNMKATAVPNFNTKFILRTDANNSGLGAVLMQAVNGKEMPIQRASKKLTPTR